MDDLVFKMVNQYMFVLIVLIVKGQRGEINERRMKSVSNREWWGVWPTKKQRICMKCHSIFEQYRLSLFKNVGKLLPGLSVSREADNKGFLFGSSRFYCLPSIKNMKLKTGSLGPFYSISSQFKMLASLNSHHSLIFVVAGLNTCKPQHNVTQLQPISGKLAYSAHIATLLPIITLLSLDMKRIFAFLELCHFVMLVLTTLLAESQATFRNISLFVRALLALEKRAPHLFL